MDFFFFGFAPIDAVIVRRQQHFTQCCTEANLEYSFNLPFHAILRDAGLTLFNSVYMVEYVALISALVATLTELWSEDYFFSLNDNMTIPAFTALALTWSLQRVASCGQV